MTFLKAVRHIVMPLVLLIVGFTMILIGSDYGFFVLVAAALYSIERV